MNVRPSTRVKIEVIRSLIKGGMKPTVAIKKVGVSATTFYFIERSEGRSRANKNTTNDMANEVTKKTLIEQVNEAKKELAKATAKAAPKRTRTKKKVAVTAPVVVRKVEPVKKTRVVRKARPKVDVIELSTIVIELEALAKAMQSIISTAKRS